MILLDENVDNRIREVLDSIGIDSVTTFEEDLSSTPDQEILEYAQRKGLVILTHDDDFLTLASESSSHASVLYIPQSTHFSEMKNRIRVLEDTDIDREDQTYFL